MHAPERRVGGGGHQVAAAQELDVADRALRAGHHRQRVRRRAQVVQVCAVVCAAKGDGVRVAGRELHGADVGGRLDAGAARLLVHAPQPHAAVVGARQEAHGVCGRKVDRPDAARVLVKLRGLARGGGVPELDQAAIVGGHQLALDVGVPGDGGELGAGGDLAGVGWARGRGWRGDAGQQAPSLFPAAGAQRAAARRPLAASTPPPHPGPSGSGRAPAARGSACRRRGRRRRPGRP